MEIAVRLPPPTYYTGKIYTTRTSLRTQDTMGIGGSTMDNPASIPVASFIYFPYFLYYLLKIGDAKDKHLNRLHRSSDPYTHLRGYFRQGYPSPRTGGADVRQEVQNKLFVDRILYFEPVICLFPPPSTPGMSNSRG